MNNFLIDLKRLMDAATKGPWEVGEYSDTLGYDCMTGGIQVGRIYLDGSDYGQSRCEEISVSALDNMQSDAELIAYLVNHAEAIRDLVVAAKKAQEAMNVWVNTYAPEFCDKEHVENSRKIISESGGTLAYIADINEQIHEALAKLEES